MEPTSAYDAVYWMGVDQARATKALGKIKREVEKLKEENAELKRQLKDAERHQRVHAEEERETW